jgi:CRISPR/Cas system-associated endoribonuclease Cas2
MMKSFGWSLQYSVFVCDLDASEVFALRAQLGSIISHGVDAIALIDVGDPKDRGRSCFSFLGPHPIYRPKDRLSCNCERYDDLTSPGQRSHPNVGAGCTEFLGN